MSDSTTNEKKIGLPTNIVALSTAIVALIGAVIGQFQIYNANKDIARIDSDIQSINRLKYSLAMPLEGKWDCSVKYRYFLGKENKNMVLDGKGISIWRGNAPKNDKNGYNFYVGGGVHPANNSDESVVTLFVDFFIEAENNGNIRTAPFETKGHYISRTASDKKFNIPPRNTINLTDGDVEKEGGVVKKITFRIKANDKEKETDGEVVFERPSP